MKWISTQDWKSFNSDGFMVIKNVVSKHLIKPACAEIASFMTLTPNKDFHGIANETKELVVSRRAPEKWRGLPQQLDPEPGRPVALTELGKKLTGFNSW